MSEVTFGKNSPYYPKRGYSNSRVPEFVFKSPWVVSRVPMQEDPDIQQT